MVVECPSCAHQYSNVTSKMIGKKVKCAACKTDFVAIEKMDENSLYGLSDGETVKSPAPNPPPEVARPVSVPQWPTRVTVKYSNNACPQYLLIQRFTSACYILSVLCIVGGIVILCDYLFGSKPSIGDPRLAAWAEQTRSQVTIYAVIGSLVAAFLWACFGAFIAMMRDMAMNLWHLRHGDVSPVLV